VEDHRPVAFDADQIDGPGELTAALLAAALLAAASSASSAPRSSPRRRSGPGEAAAGPASCPRCVARGLAAPRPAIASELPGTRELRSKVERPVEDQTPIGHFHPPNPTIMEVTMPNLSLSPSEWKLLQALIAEQAHHATGYPSGEPVLVRLGMPISEGRDHMDMLERIEMIKLYVRNPVPHFDVLWRGREEAAKRGESIPSPVADAETLIAFLRDMEDGTKQVNDRDIVQRFGWGQARALDAARVLVDRGQVKLHTPLGGSFFLFLTSLGRRRP
jgi:hypothetical protein